MRHPTNQRPQGGATELKAKFDALGVAIRAGVDQHSAASMLGLDGIEFNGMVPVNLKMPEEGPDVLRQSESDAGTAQTA